MKTYDCEILYRPEQPELRFLPEGPIWCGNDMMTWVAIQHGPDQMIGSLNVFNLRTKANQCFELPGRPGFAFPTTQNDAYVVGLELTLGIYDAQIREWTVLETNVDQDVDGTIINDGLAFEGGLIFGCKDLKFQDKKAGLYFWRKSDHVLHRLRNDQICSNGKALIRQNGDWTLLDIDSPTKTVVAYPFNPDRPALGEPRTVVDLRNGDGVPDGMILTPDEQSVIVALYNPADAPYGEARQYSIATGDLEAVWRTPASPQVTCPLLVELDGQVKLVLTTAVEHMPAERQERYPNAGCLFIGDTHFDRAPEPYRYVLQ